jgi:uncharacterized membrane protein
MPNLHPVLVHFPIALLTASVAFDLCGIVLRRQELERSGWWTLVIGCAGLVLTVVSGLLAKESVTITQQAQGHFDVHQQLAFAVAGVYALLLLWRIASRTRLPLGREWLFITLSLAGSLLLWLGAWHGGEMVYRFGVGVRP